MSSTHRLTFSAGELRGGELRVPVRSGNSRTFPGTFEGVDLETGRGAREGIRAQAKMASGLRVVTVSPRIMPGDTIRATVQGTKLVRTLLVAEVAARRLRDVRVVDQFDPEAWKRRHGTGAYAANPWCWCLRVRR